MLLEPMLSRLKAARGLRETLAVALQDVIALHGAEMGNIQMYDAAGRLFVVAQRGLSPAFLQAFDRLPLDSGTVCGKAARRQATVFVPDVELDPDFAPFAAYARTVPFRSVLSSPLVSSDGQPVGVVSAHFANRYAPTRLEVESLERYCRRVADALVERLKGSDWVAAAEALAAELRAGPAGASGPTRGSVEKSLPR